MEKYTPELLLGLMVMVKNIALVVACAWTTVTLYKLSGSWHRADSTSKCNTPI